MPAALSIGTAASSVSRIGVFRASIRWDVVRRFVPTALPAAALGAWLLTRFEPVYVELLLACFLLANLPALLRRRPAEASAQPPLPLGRVPLLGAMAGLLSGFTGAVGLLFNGAYQRMGLDRHEIVATRATNEVLLHALKIALYAAFGLLDGAALAAGLVVAVAAVTASLLMRRVLPLISEGGFRRLGQSAMVAAGAAMLTLSSTQIADLHRAWVAMARIGDERELQLYWAGARRFALEAESEGGVVLERAIPFASLPPAVRQRVGALVSPAAITLVEEVRGAAGRSYEIYYTARDGAARKIELPG